MTWTEALLDIWVMGPLALIAFIIVMWATADDPTKGDDEGEE